MTVDLDWPETLPAALASRILHDLAGPASAVVSGLNLQADPALFAMRQEALALATSSAARMLALLGFCREAFGGAGEIRDNDGLLALARSQFDARRTKLEWEVKGPPPAGPPTQALLILLQIAAGGLARGGAARVTADIAGGWVEIKVRGDGRSPRLAPEAIDGLAGRSCPRGLQGRWAPARYLHGIVAAAGGSLIVEANEADFMLLARLPDPDCPPDPPGPGIPG